MIKEVEKIKKAFIDHGYMVESASHSVSTAKQASKISVKVRCSDGTSLSLSEVGSDLEAIQDELNCFILPIRVDYLSTKDSYEFTSVRVIKREFVRETID